MRLLADNCYVLTDLSGEKNLTRGDCQAYRGIGKLFAEKTSLPWHCVENDDQYLTLKDEIGLPDVVFAFKHRPEYESVYWTNEINEYLTDYIRHPLKSNLVAHHITSAMLQKEKDTFKAAHPDIKGPLIAIMNIKSDEDCDWLSAKGLIDMIEASGNPEATIFICGTGRTDYADQQRLIYNLREKITQRGLAQSIAIKSYAMSKEFNKQAAQYNPYVGLIASADHFLVIGNSMSIVSECLMSGKSLMLMRNGGHERLVENGICQKLWRINTGDGFPTRDIDPINITGDIVDYFVEHFQQYELNKAARLATTAPAPF